MRKQHVRAISVSGLLILLLSQSASAAGCPESTAREAESGIDGIVSIEQARTYFRVFRQCLDGPIAYGFINKLAELATRPNGIDDLWKGVKHDPLFRDAVLRMLPSEAVPLDVSNQLLQACKDHCPKNARTFCTTLAKRVRKACAECQP